MSVRSRIMQLVNHAALAFKGTKVQDVFQQPATQARPAATLVENQYEYNPDAETDELMKPVLNPVIAFHEALRAEDPTKLPAENPFRGVKVSVSEAFVYEGMFDETGRLASREAREAKGIRWPASYRIRHIKGNDAYLETIRSARHEWETGLPSKVVEAERLRKERMRIMDGLKAAGLYQESFGDEWCGFDANFGPYDPNQYTEYAPTYGGPFFKQLYLTDYLRMHTLAFEAWNHNPIAKRIIDVLAQYALGRRFKVRIKDAKKAKIWEDFNREHGIRENVSRYWVREYCIYGEIMLNVKTWQLIDPSTVWDIITNPDDLSEVYYYYQSYPTAYQMFTGYRVPGEPGSQNVKGQEYIMRQIPAHEVLHLKGNCVSNEKRGRSILFPILGWLKRIRDLYNAIVVRQWLLSCFIWDDTIKGSAADIAAHAAQYNRMPTVGSTFVHNESVVRTPMAAIEGSGGRGASNGIGEELIAFIATAVGIPKEFLNVISQGGSRATALTSAEPFTKVVEDLQAVFESLLTACIKYAFEQAGVEYVEGDVELLFPSVTKDTTTETIKNIATGEAMGYIAKQTAAEMFAAEMNITNFDFVVEQKRIGDEVEKGLNKTSAAPMPPPGRFGAGPGSDTGNGGSDGNPNSNPDDEEETPIHGTGKVALSRSLKKV